jgi:hypothetical protein
MRGTVSTTPLPAETYLWMPGPTVDLSGVPLVELLVQDVLVTLHTLEQLPTVPVYTPEDKIKYYGGLVYIYSFRHRCFTVAPVRH